MDSLSRVLEVLRMRCWRICTVFGVDGKPLWMSLRAEHCCEYYVTLDGPPAESDQTAKNHRVQERTSIVFHEGLLTPTDRGELERFGQPRETFVSQQGGLTVCLRFRNRPEGIKSKPRNLGARDAGVLFTVSPIGIGTAATLLRLPAV